MTAPPICFDPDMVRLRFSLAVHLSALALLAAGCGDEEPDTPTSTSVTSTASSTTTSPNDVAADEEEIRETITALESENDPSLCEEVLTQRFLDQAFPPAGPEALEYCRTLQLAAFKLEAENVRFETIAVDGDEATASFEPLGPGSGGAIFTVALIREGRTWKLDLLERAEIIDRERFDVTLRASGTNGPNGLAGSEADCVVEELSDISDEALERRYVSENASVPVSALTACVGDGTEIGVVSELARRGLAADPDFEPLADCVARELEAELTKRDAIAFLKSEDRATVELARNVAIDACGGGPGGVSDETPA